MEHGIGSGRRLDVSSDEGERFVMLMFHYLWVASVLLVTALIISRTAHRRAREHEKEHIGVFASAEWHIALRGPASMLMVLLLVIPTILLFVCFVLGAILAALEGWSAVLGVEYVISNVLGLMDPLTSITPDTTYGTLVDVVISMWAMLIITTAMGLAAGMSLVTSVMDSMPKTFAGFARYLFVYIPLCLVFIAMVTGGLMAAIEDWAYLDGFYFMVGQICGLANPLTAVSPATAQGCFLETLCVSIELCLGGAVIGVVGGHPLTGILIQWIEGKGDDGEETKPVTSQETSDEVVPNGVAKDTRDADRAKRLEVRAAELRGEFEAIQRELQHLRKTGATEMSIEDLERGDCLFPSSPCQVDEMDTKLSSAK